METIELDSWSDFPLKLEEIHEKYGVQKHEGFVEKNVILYRGQADSDWQLETTLERFSTQPWSIQKYAILLERSSLQLESFTDNSFKLPSYEDLCKKLKQDFNPSDVLIPFYEFWVYVRHHGFPSPLLDWTFSPYIAAFFAFEEQNNAEKASVYVYIETPKGTKSGWVGAPQITVRGPYVRTHKRHFLQQAWYTIATQSDKKRGEHNFICHEEIF